MIARSVRKVAASLLLVACRPSAPVAPGDARRPEDGDATPQPERTALRSLDEYEPPSTIAAGVRVVLYDGAQAVPFDRTVNEPLLVVFDDGRVLGRSDPKAPDWREHRLSAGELDALVAELDPAALAALPAATSCKPGWWFQPITRIAIRTDTGWMLRQLHGRQACDRIAQAHAAGDPDPHRASIEGDFPSPEHTASWPWEHERVPPAFARAYARLLAVLPADAKRWTPEGFTVQMRRQLENGEPIEPWPEGVPPPPVLRASASGHAQHVDGVHYPAFQVFDRERAPGLLFDERRWYVVIERETPGGDVGQIAEFADAIGCAHEARQRLACAESLTTDRPIPSCLEAIRAAADPATCQAERPQWMNACSSSVSLRCGF